MVALGVCRGVLRGHAPCADSGPGAGAPVGVVGSSTDSSCTLVCCFVFSVDTWVFCDCSWSLASATCVCALSSWSAA